MSEKVLIYIFLYPISDKKTELFQAFPYASASMQFLKSSYPGHYFIDVDSYSEPLLWDYLLKLMESAEQVLLFIEDKEDTELGKLTFFLRKAFRFREKTLVYSQGLHEVVHQLLIPWPNSLEIDFQDPGKLLGDF